MHYTTESQDWAGHGMYAQVSMCMCGYLSVYDCVEGCGGGVPPPRRPSVGSMSGDTTDVYTNALGYTQWQAHTIFTPYVGTLYKHTRRSMQ